MHWDKPLTYEVRLTRGHVLCTLHDLREVFASDRFADVTHWRALEHTLELLLHAAETGAEADIEAAIDQACIVFRLLGMLVVTIPIRR